MKPDMTLAEQKERETLASRVYAATVNLDAANAALVRSQDDERDAWRAYRDNRDMYEGGITDSPAATEASRLAHMLAQSVLEQAEKRAEDAHAEREDALEAEKDFRTRMDARPALACDYCEAEAEIVREDEALCGPCDTKLQADWETMIDEQERDFNAGISGGIHREH